MVGVPRGKRCEMCKERRRKCDGKTPSCSLCQRLKCPCIRPGKQFVFVGSRHDLPAGGDSNVTDPSTSSSGTEDDDDAEPVVTTHSSQSDLSVIPYTPPSSSATTQLAQTLSWVLNDRENLGYSLMSTFGSFLQEVPKHLGHCPALDASVKVMVSGYSSFRLNNDNLNLVVAKEYAQALLQLRNDVASFSGQGLPLIIAAVTILALFETIDGSIKTGWMAHAGGASRLIKSPSFNAPESELSKKLLENTRGTLVVEALMTEESFDPSSRLWHQCVEIPSYQSEVQKETYRYLATMPSLRKKTMRALLEWRTCTSTLYWHESYLELQTVAQDYQPVYEAMLEELENQILASTSRENSTDTRSFQKDAKVLKTLKYCFPAIITQLLLHAWLSFFDPAATANMKQAAQRICGYVPLGMQFRPLGSAHMTMPLRVAYIGVTSDVQRAWVKDQVNTIHQDIQGPRAHLVTLKELDWWADTISLKCLSATTMPWAVVARDPANSRPEAIRQWAEAREARLGPSDDYLVDDSYADPVHDFRNYNELADAIERQTLGGSSCD